MKKTILVLILLALATGCSSSRLSKKVDVSTEATHKQVKGYQKKLDDMTLPVNLVEKSPEAWFSSKSSPKNKAVAELPSVFRQQITIERFMTMQEAAERITIRTGVPVKIDTDLMASSGSTTGVSTGATVSASTTSNSSSRSYNIRYSGTVSGLLDTVSARMGFSWKYQAGQILFYTLDTKTFIVNAIPGDSALTNNVGSNSSSAGAGGGAVGGAGATAGGGGSNSTNSSNQLTSVTSNLSVWNNIRDTVTSMLTSRGKAIVSPSTGSITVTDTPEILSRVERYIDNENKNLSRQVFVSVKVLSLELNDADNYSINWDLVFRSVTSQFGLNLVNNFPSVANATSLSAQVLSTATGTAARWNGSDAVLSALSSQGKVSVITSATVVALNNQPTPIQVGRQISYLQSSTTTQTANVGSANQLTPGVLNTGFSMNVLPHMLEGGRMLLQYAIDISSLSKLNTVSSGGSTIQTPEVDTRNFLSRISMRSGETLVLSGFEQASDNLDNSGFGSPKNTALGGSMRAGQNRTKIVVVLTPVSSEGF